MQHSQYFPSIIKLNVGGHYFTTSLQTLTKDPNSMFTAMFSGKFEMKIAEDGAYFIDRDGTHFRFILNYLRTGKLTLPERAKFLKELQEEVEFYNLQGMLDDLGFNSEILTDKEHRKLLLSWLPPEAGLQGRRRRLRLLFRASRDGFSAATFHSRCDNKGPTLTIVQSGENIFGGFGELSWTALRGTSCKEAFVFSMVNPHSRVPTKVPMEMGYVDQSGWYGPENNYGPTFGDTYRHFTLRISDNANIIPSEVQDSRVYRLPSDTRAFFTGHAKFLVNDYEVFTLLN